MHHSIVLHSKKIPQNILLGINNIQYFGFSVAKLTFRLGLGLVVGLPLVDVGLASIQAVDEVGRLGNAKPRFRFTQPAVK